MLLDLLWNEQRAEQIHILVSWRQIGESQDLPSDRKVSVKIIRSKVSSALLCEINWNLALPMRFFLKTCVVAVWVQCLEVDAGHGMSDTTFWLEMGLWGFLLLASDTYVEKLIFPVEWDSEIKWVDIDQKR